MKVARAAVMTVAVGVASSMSSVAVAQALLPSNGDDALTGALHWITRGVELVGIAIIVMGALFATGRYLLAIGSALPNGRSHYHAYRSNLGRSILLGLEFLVAADIIGTVAIEPSLDSVLILGGIVLIRTFLSFSLEIEIEGKLPWKAPSRPPEESSRTEGSAGATERT